MIFTVNKKNIQAIMPNFKNSNYLGALASTLCLIHCLATPFLFIIQTCSNTCCEASPTWWRSLDYLFLTLSFFAVYHSNKTTSNVWIGRALWISWFLLFIQIQIQIFGWMKIPSFIEYLPALVLISLHLYNQKFCKCSDNCIH
ncbi:MAG: MerC domain-containing protein [Bacteroidia bacterium]|nr:MerC domain-containing protein [Bacteroidia bacterium]